MHNNLTLPSNPSTTDAETYDKLSKLAGKQFDEAYAKAMVKDHEEDVAEFQRESSNGKNDAIKSFASKTLPTLQSHLQQAKEMAKTVQASL
jgi:putative membrane protein